MRRFSRYFSYLGRFVRGLLLLSLLGLTAAQAAEKRDLTIIPIRVLTTWWRCCLRWLRRRN